MSKMLLNLRNVAEDEASEVRALLDANAIDYYETRPSPWGISFGGIWIRDNAEHARAKALMAGYQARRAERVRAERQAALADGTAETFGSLLRRRPLFVVAVLLGMVVVASLVLLPFFLLTR
ncbi:DUF6164 family protein [Stenotrophomonas sp. YIM B06876]|uniref:DUF6164 family protein n=1 Tax=Stenotrophomonas sp. YIM B06876 TaxID=3060211 RepID=UPI002739F27D|nr:DUF6164 family protein [Stenotrophomonas sp. YIM B06876]